MSFPDGLFTWDALSHVSDLTSLVTVISSLVTLYAVTLGRRARHRRWFREARQRAKSRVAILIIDLKPQADIRAQVERARHEHETLRDPDAVILTLQRDRPVGVEDIPGIVQELRGLAAEVMKAGADSVCLIYAGPVQIASLVGYELRTLPNVQLFHYESGRYVSWGPMQHPLF